MPTHHSRPYDVIIAGAGPVGLFLACELGLAGRSVLLLERAAGPEPALKVLPFGLRGLTVPTVESLDRRDLLAPLLARIDAEGAAATAPWTRGARRPGGHFAGLQFFHDRVDDAAWAGRRPDPAGMLAVAMADLEAVLAGRAVALGVTIRYGCGVDAVEARADGVLVDAGGERFAAGWLVGCDGARSTVRNAAGIAFAGTDPEFTGYSMAVRLADPDALPAGRRYGADGMYTYAPPATVTMIEFDGGARHRAEPPSREEAEAVLRRVSGADVRIAAMDRIATWTDRAFLAADYRRDRVLLAGDAAHIHAPLGGQGLNLGLGDAMNLGWKLAATIAGAAPATLLDSYAAERRPVAEGVLDWSRAQVALLRPDPGAAALRSIVGDLIDTRDGATYFARRIWGTELQVGDAGAHSPVGRSAPDLVLDDGRRLAEALRDGRAVLVDMDPAQPLRAVAAAWGDRLVHVVATTPLEPGVDALLVRPDGVVAWAGRAALEPAIVRWLGDA